jgi:hypothetical protein
MALTPEHQFISTSIDVIINKYSKASLFGVNESQRRTFDYSCILLRDFSRPLVSQVMWGHAKGVEKDLRTLLHDKEALIKLYIVKDNIRNRARLEEILTSYKTNEGLRKLLVGLRLVFVPSDFDADREEDQVWLYNYLQERFSNDILFAIIFGQLTGFDFHVFADHGGPIGLKYVVLDEIVKNSLQHMPTFRERIGYKSNSSLREALTMLSALGLIKRPLGTNLHFPTIKGRLLLDLTRRVLYEQQYLEEWSEEIRLIFKHLGMSLPSLVAMKSREERVVTDDFILTLIHAEGCKKDFGRDLMDKIDPEKPIFCSQYHLPEIDEMLKTKVGLTREFFSEPEALFFVNET